MDRKYWISDEAYAGLYRMAVDQKWCFPGRHRTEGLSAFIEAMSINCTMIDARPPSWKDVPPGYAEPWSFDYQRKPRRLNFSETAVDALYVHAVVLGLFSPNTRPKGRSHLRTSSSQFAVAGALLEAIGSGLVRPIQRVERGRTRRFVRRSSYGIYSPEWTRHVGQSKSS